jgi:hypothetical protein
MTECGLVSLSYCSVGSVFFPYCNYRTIVNTHCCLGEFLRAQKSAYKRALPVRKTAHTVLFLVINFQCALKEIS